MSYREDYTKYLAKMGFKCHLLTDDQMDEIGMAAERAQLDWDWSTASPDDCNAYNTREETVARIEAAQGDIAGVFMCSDETPTEDSLVAAYVGGFYCDYGI